MCGMNLPSDGFVRRKLNRFSEVPRSHELQSYQLPGDPVPQSRVPLSTGNDDAPLAGRRNVLRGALRQLFAGTTERRVTPQATPQCHPASCPLSLGDVISTLSGSAWLARRARRATQILLIALYDDRAAICGSTGEQPPVHFDLNVGCLRIPMNVTTDSADRDHRCRGQRWHGGIESYRSRSVKSGSRFFRIEAPFKGSRWALCNSLSSIASASVGSLR